MLCEEVHLSPKQLFLALDKLWDPFAGLGGGLEGVQYGDIIRNQGQAYQIVSGEQDFVSCPTVFIRVVGVHSQRSVSCIGVFPADIFRLILSHVREEDLICFGKTCKSARHLISNETMWLRWTDRILYVNNTLLVFESSSGFATLVFF